jgi:nicotinamide mononucleotide (NMN) deamidase PncC
MARAITNFTNSNYGVGVTGQINKQDPNNPYGTVGEVFFSIYDKDNDKYYEYSLNTNEKTRKENKDVIVDYISTKLLEVLDIDN